MSNETDLDWLARNVHEWVEDWTHVRKCQVRHEAKWMASLSPNAEYKDWRTKDQWLARRAELQNKPSWRDAPEWAEWLAQDEDGEWKWLAGLPGKYVDGWTAVKIKGCCKGSTLGDWRDTLEQRPVDLSESAVTERLTEATQNVLAAVPNLLGEQFKFEHNTKPVTVSNETVQLEQPIAVTGTGNGSASESAFLIGRVIDLLRSSMDHFSADELADLNELTGAELTKRDAAVCGGQKYLDAHWFERGELPPVDARVMHMGTATDKDWLEVEIIAHAQRKGFNVAVFEYPGGVSFSSATYFRPIRTEREVLIEHMQSDIAERWANCEELATHLVDKGWVKVGK